MGVPEEGGPGAGPPDRLDAGDVARLGGPGWDVRAVRATGSTNADLAAAARAGAEHGRVLLAGEQTAGRGRLGRDWSSPPSSSLSMSVLVRPGAGAAGWTWLPLLTGVAVAAGLGDLTGLDARLKWPNDVLVSGRKVCGVLAERVDTATGPAAVLGVGVNVGQAAGALPTEGATSLRVLLGNRCPSRDAVAGAVLAALRARYATWAAGGRAAVRSAYRERCATLGRPVRVLQTDRVTEGTATDVDDDGRLVVRTAAGVCLFGAGDVVHLR